MTPTRKVILIFFLFLITVYISLPEEVPVKLQAGRVNIDQILYRPGLDLAIGRFRIKKDFNLVLGLDLAGGSHLVFEADTSKISPDKRASAVEATKNIIERRVNLFGVSEPVVQTSTFNGKENIIVELPGVNDTKEAIDIIGRTAQLTFSTSAEPPVLVPTNLTGADLSFAKVGFDSKTGNPVVDLQFTPEGAAKFEKITGDNVGKPVVISLDTDVISAPQVSEKISGGNAQISGSFTLDEVKKLVVQLNAGALPIPIKPVSETTVGATLGKESVQKSVSAGVLGLFMVLLFMVLVYGRLGLVADLGLIIFGTITLALYKLIPVVLTLPGIAGFLLSVGMAVDSNILIFERFKEERLRRDIPNALEVSFGRAWDSIRDANIATLVTCFILANPFDWPFLNVSGPVRGFALTLALGIAISLFTGIVVSRNLLRLFITEGKTIKEP